MGLLLHTSSTRAAVSHQQKHTFIQVYRCTSGTVTGMRVFAMAATLDVHGGNCALRAQLQQEYQPGVPVYRYCTYLYTCMLLLLGDCSQSTRGMQQQLYRYTGVQVVLLPACEFSPWLQRWVCMVVTVRLEHSCNRNASLVYRYTGIVHTCTPVCFCSWETAARVLEVCRSSY